MAECCYADALLNVANKPFVLSVIQIKVVMLIVAAPNLVSPFRFGRVIQPSIKFVGKATRRPQFRHSLA